MDEPQPRVFETPRSQTTHAILLFFGGLALFGFVFVFAALAGLASSKSASSAPPIAPIMLGILAVGLIGAALMKVRHSQRIAVVQAGMHIDGAFGGRFVPWADVRHARMSKVQSVGMANALHVLDLFDNSGALITRVGTKISDFGTLVLIITAVIRQTHATPPDEVWIARAQRRTSRGNRLFMYVVGIPVSLGFAAGGVWGAYEVMKNHQFATDGIVVAAKIDQLTMKSVTPYVAYSFADGAGATHRRESMMEELPWTLLHARPTVNVQYLKSDPEWNRLVSGSTEAELGLGVTIACFCMSTFFLSAIGLTMSGWDLRSEDGRALLLHNCRLVRAWGKSTAGPPLEAPPLDLATLPASLALPARHPPGLILVGAAVIALGTGMLLLHAIGVLVCVAIAANVIDLAGSYASESDFAIDFARQLFGAVAGLLGVIAGVAVLRFWRSGWRSCLIAMMAILVSALARLYTQIHTMATLPDLPGQQGVAVRMGLILGVLLDVALIAAAITIVVVLARRDVKTFWAADERG